MATIVTILIEVIPLLGKRNELTREVFWWLVAGREHLIICFLPKKLKMHAGRWCDLLCHHLAEIMEPQGTGA